MAENLSLDGQVAAQWGAAVGACCELMMDDVRNRTTTARRL
jgi:hypothetical protein